MLKYARAAGEGIVKPSVSHGGGVVGSRGIDLVRSAATRREKKKEKHGDGDQTDKQGRMGNELANSLGGLRGPSKRPWGG